MTNQKNLQVSEAVLVQVLTLLGNMPYVQVKEVIQSLEKDIQKLNFVSSDVSSDSNQD